MCFFFFKQKTAYEMRISDWSSDVCSSDLSQALAEHPAVALGVLSGVDAVADPRLLRLTQDRRACRTCALVVCVDVAHLDEEPVDEIGRASCRERVCQYV